MSSTVEISRRRFAARLATILEAQHSEYAWTVSFRATDDPEAQTMTARPGDGDFRPRPER